VNQFVRQAGVLAIGATLTFASVSAIDYDQQIEYSQITVNSGREGCAVELDSITAGKTDARGTSVLRAVDPGDHYIHVRCAGQDDLAFFVSPREGENLEIHPGSSGSIVPAPAASPLEAADQMVRLRQLIHDSIQLRAKGHIEEAVRQLREAAKLDPENSDLHRELGITFLLVKEWKRARVEMLEAIRHEPNDSDAHNGLGYALEKMGQLDAALKEYRIATHLDPDDPSYRQHYIDVMSRLSEQQVEKKK